LGGNIDCAAQCLEGHELILDMIRNLCLTKNAADIHKDNCVLLIRKVRKLQDYIPFENKVRIFNAIEKQNINYTVHDRLLANLGVFCSNGIFTLSNNQEETLQQMLLATEFMNRCFENRVINRHLNTTARVSDEEIDSTSIRDYVSNITQRLELFSAGLFTLNRPSSPSYTMCLILKQSAHVTDVGDSDNSCTHQYLVPRITERDAPGKITALLLQPSRGYKFLQIYLYNLSDQDLLLSRNPLRSSAQLCTDDFVVRQRVDGDIPKHDANTVPAHGFGYLNEIVLKQDFTTLEHDLMDAHGKVVVTIMVQYKK